jgi:GDPmannose 4,6-dehydratase
VHNLRSAIVIGATGQDGSYLIDLLLQKGYRVWGLIRRSSSFNTGRIDHIISKQPSERFDWLRGDLTDSNSLSRLIHEANPDEIYNLGAQSHVKVSFEIPVYTFDVVALGTLRLLEAVRNSDVDPKIYQAGSSEMFGSSPPPQNETTPFRPRSPYAVAKVAAHHICVEYREAYGMWISNGILFNHESPRRGETFVTRKVTRAVARIALGVQSELVLGNIDTKRDWGYAPEYVEMMWKMLQQDEPDDYVISTGESHTVREFVEEAFRQVGIVIKWSGQGIGRRGIVDEIIDSDFLNTMKVKKGDTIIRLSQEYFRPTEAEDLVGDSSKAAKKLGWKPKVTFHELVKIMVDSDVRKAQLLLEGTKKYNEEWRESLL